MYYQTNKDQYNEIFGLNTKKRKYQKRKKLDEREEKSDSSELENSDFQEIESERIKFATEDIKQKEPISMSIPTLPPLRLDVMRPIPTSDRSTLHVRLGIIYRYQHSIKKKTFPCPQLM